MKGTREFKVVMGSLEAGKRAHVIVCRSRSPWAAIREAKDMYPQCEVEKVEEVEESFWDDGAAS